MAAGAYNFDEAREKFRAEVKECLSGEDRKNNFVKLKELHTSSAGSDQEKNFSMDMALRDLMFELMAKGSSCTEYTRLVDLSANIATMDLCTPSCLFIMLSDILDCITLDKCAEVFAYIEENLERWKTQKFQAAGKNYLLRMCNDLLRRLSKSQNTLFCGRIQVFLARFFPLMEKSGINLYSHFNVDNVTFYKTAEEYDKSRKQNTDSDKEKDDSMEVEEGEMTDHQGVSVPVDYNLYRKFWHLQDYFRKPTQCYDKKSWQTFQENSELVLGCFESYKLDDISKSSTKKKRESKHKNKVEEDPVPETKKETTYFAKYLTSEKLLDLQLSDAHFRRHVLVQHVILFQYLNATVRFKQSQQVLNDTQSAWIRTNTDRVYALMKETPPDGEQFARTVQHVLSREENWNTWKNNECQSYVSGKQDNKDTLRPGRKRTLAVAGLGDPSVWTDNQQVQLGKDELTRLWNICADNMEACKSETRKFMPDINKFFETVILEADPTQQVEEEYKLVNKEIFCWKSLRLLARKSIHFCLTQNTTAKNMKEYLLLLVDKIQKESPAYKEKMAKLKTEEESVGTPDDQSQTSVVSEGAASEEVNPAEDQENEDYDLTAMVQSSEIRRVSEEVGSRWPEVAHALGVEEEDVDYYMTEEGEDCDRARKMFTVWAETKSPTREEFIAALKDAHMYDVAESVFKIKS